MRTSQSPPQNTIKKPLRKGTKSCVQCRKRKIKCIFSPEIKDVCQQCVTRGCECIDQRLVARQSGKDESLRQKIKRLEGLLGEVLGEKGDGRIHEGDLGPKGQSVEDEDMSSADESAPIVSLLVDSQELSSKVSRKDANSFPEKYGQICKTIRHSLPGYEELIDILTKNGLWWEVWRQKTFGTSKPSETLSQYAARVYLGKMPANISTLAFAYARTTNVSCSRLLELVEKEILSDFDIASTMQGLECIILQAKYYFDIGKPRKAWLAYRNGISLAQIKKLQHNHSQVPSHSCIWNTLYYGDLFTSLILGLPYAITASHCSPQVKHPTSNEDPVFTSHPFTAQCFTIASKIIDRNQSSAPPSVAKAISLDEDIDSLASSMPKSWWDLSSQHHHETESLQQALYSQILFFHLRTYLHLPFLLLTSDNSKFDYSKTTCVISAREMVKRYHLLRSEIEGKALFECKTNDFLGFMANLVLLIGVYHGVSRQVANDWVLIQTSLDVFRHLCKKEPTCNMTSQCASALEKLIDFQNEGNQGRLKIITIPHFGVLSLSSRLSPSSVHPTPASSVLPHGLGINSVETLELSTMTNLPLEGFQALENQELLYKGPYTSNFEVGDISSFGGSSFEWMDFSMVDIDRNWDMFLGDGIATQEGWLR